MKNTFGNSLQITIFGESHGPYIGCVLDSPAPGIPVDKDVIDSLLSKRRPAGTISTKRVENDEYSIVSGVYNGYTTGTPVCIIIPNTAQKSSDYENTVRAARPGHADYTAHVKYNGFEDFRGGGHFSGRVTAALVAAAGIIMPELNRKNICIGTHIKSCGGVSDRELFNIKADIDALAEKDFAVLDDTAAKSMRDIMEQHALDGDSVGGVLETAVTGLPAGLGEPWFDTAEGVLSHALFSIPAVKGVQFGAGFDLVDSSGSVFNDDFMIDEGRVVTSSNNNGGINGGITNGMPVIFRCAVKPTPSIYKEQNTIELDTLKETRLRISGRHDPAIIHRARIVVDCVTALVLYDMLACRFGTDYFGEKR